MGAARNLKNLILSGEGTLSAEFGPGRLSNFDLASFLDRSRKGGFFAMGDHAAGSTASDGLVFDATISRGVAKIRKAEALVERRRLWLSGLASYPDKGLALTGGIASLPEDGSPDTVIPDATFFVGGSWSAPFISPIAPPTE
jgi:AsmA protein